MSFTGTVKDGVVVLPPGVNLPEGLEVQLTVPDSASPEEAFVLHESASPFPAVDGLPDDLAINHDYYLHGHHKQQPRRGRWIRADMLTPELTQQEAVDYTERLLAFARKPRTFRLTFLPITTTICTVCPNDEPGVRRHVVLSGHPQSG